MTSSESRYRDLRREFDSILLDLTPRIREAIEAKIRDLGARLSSYKEQALQLWRASGRSAAKVAAELGIRPLLLYRWARLERLPATTAPAGVEAPPWRGRTGGGDPALAHRER